MDLAIQGMMLIKKGVKARKKRLAGGGGGSAGTFPSGSVPLEMGVVSSEYVAGLPNPFDTQSIASVMVRDSTKTNASGVVSFAQLTNASGTNINSSSQPELTVADYIASNLRGQPLPSTNFSNPVQAGVVYISTNSFTEDARLAFRVHCYNQNNSFNGAELIVTDVVNEASVPILSNNASPSSPALMTHNPPRSGNIILEFDTRSLSSEAELILQFQIRVSPKVGGPQETTTADPSDPASLYVSSSYIKIGFLP